MRLLNLFYLVAICACTTSAAGDGKEKLVAASTDSEKVLVELFTSQGCSSCPSADRLLSNLAQSDTNLVVLSFHVDYWDRLGWKDVFSSHDYTVRQQHYAQMFGANTVYTPQAVVQGQFQMVGSNGPGIKAALAKAREQNSSALLSAHALQNGNVVDINFSINKTVPNGQLIAALVQTHTNTSIQRGENSGVQLEGYNVVRNFKVTSAVASGKLSLQMPADLKKDNASVILFVQNTASQKIESVIQAKL